MARPVDLVELDSLPFEALAVESCQEDSAFRGQGEKGAGILVKGEVLAAAGKYQLYQGLFL